MASFLTASLVWTLLVFSFSVSADQINIRAEPGDNVILPCREAENRHFEAAEWKKTNQRFCLYRIDSFGEDKPECSNSRADLLDVEKGDMSLVLKNVTTDDTGTYECWIKETTNNRRKRSIQDYKPISTVNLRVEAGNKDEIKEDGGNKTGLIAGLTVCALVVVGVVAAVFYKRSRDSSLKSKRPPPAAADAEKKLTGPDE